VQDCGASNMSAFTATISQTLRPSVRIPTVHAPRRSHAYKISSPGLARRCSGVQLLYASRKSTSRIVGVERRGVVRCVSANAAAAGDGVVKPSGISNAAATANVVKSIMGAGCFALPWAFAQTGYLFTTAYMIAAAALCMYCVACMQRAREIVVAKDPSVQPSTESYSGLSVATIGPIGGKISQLMVLVCCFGISSAYLVFVASTLVTVLQAPIPGAPFTQNFLITCITPILVALSWMRSFSGVSIISLFGNISVVIGMVAVLVYASGLGFNMAAIPAVNLAGFPVAFGSVAFLFFVHFTMPPIESAMEKPKDFFGSALNAFILSTVVSAAFGIVGAICFGPDVPSVVITAMKGASVVAVVKLLLCMNLLCTFPIVTRGAFQILEEFMGGEENLSDIVIYSTRSAFVIAAAYCAIAIPSFGKLLGLVGGVCCTALTMIFPPLMLLAASKAHGIKLSFLEVFWLFLIIIGGVGIAGLSIGS